MMDDGFSNRSAEPGHTFGQPARHATAMKRKICDSGTLHGQIVQSPTSKVQRQVEGTFEIIHSPRSGRWRKAWGEAQRNPRIAIQKTSKPAERPTVESSLLDVVYRTAIDRFAGSAKLVGLAILGFRCAPPQALRLRLLRRLFQAQRLSCKFEALIFNAGALFLGALLQTLIVGDPKLWRKFGCS